MRRLWRLSESEGVLLYQIDGRRGVGRGLEVFKIVSFFWMGDSASCRYACIGMVVAFCRSRHSCYAGMDTHVGDAVLPCRREALMCVSGHK